MESGKGFLVVKFRVGSFGGFNKDKEHAFVPLYLFVVDTLSKDGKR